MIPVNQEATNKSPIKLVRDALNAPLTDVDDTNEIGVDKWRQVDLVNAVESGLMVNVGVAEHPTTKTWDTTFWWHEAAGPGWGDGGP